MTSSPSTAFCRLAPLLLLLLLGCGGGDGSATVEPPETTVVTLADVLAGKEATPEVRAELENLTAAGTEELVTLSGRVQSGELTPAEADEAYHEWLAGEAAGRSLTAEQLGRLLAGYAGGRYR
ncbi:MAG: hypothetical protein A2Y64_03390 [Candidatus Coatesbacteria bacterium RBG_13_66_14]|uniref:Uncharacterized protein n=1 Tax=Candidatus Coatesbacteria bacterium RBG_13_66_14 TaxID=1817816 RepID=A0A1F5EVT3_9BACT|nr:MAG: hypothetical protein A2Y64_03390 [Candidatus Coatesbacteria bacterium RBG_13_66_14]